MSLRRKIRNKGRFFAAFVFVVMLSACASKWSQYYIHFSKEGSPAIESIYDIGRQYYENFPNINNNLKKAFLEDMSYMGGVDIESMKKTYRLSLYFKVDYTENDGKRIDSHELGSDSVLVGLCENDNNSLRVSAYRVKYPSESSRPAGTYGVHLQIERLKKEGIITGTPETQEAICIFQKGKIKGFLAPKIITKSNNVIYTADEISELVREYEALQ